MISTIKSMGGRFVSKEGAKACLASIGFVATFLEVVDYFDDSIVDSFPKYFIPLVLLFVLVITYLSVRPKKALKYKIPGRNQSIEIIVDDIFNHKNIVITADRALSTDRIGRESLVTQLLEKEPHFKTVLTSYKNKESDFKLLKSGAVINLIDDLKTSTSTTDQSTFEDVLLLACGSPSENGTDTDWSSLSESFTGLWQHLRAENMQSIAIPVIGSGYSKARLNHSAILQMILLSYVSANKDKTIVKSIKIVVDEEDYSWDDWLRADSLLHGLDLERE